MFQQTPLKRVLFPHTLKSVMVGGFLACLVLFSILLAIFGTSTAEAATNSTINFQARLQNAAGNIAPDGNYNVQFKLYSASSGGTALWTETYQNSNSQGITVKNGYLTANLGSITAFPGTINWDQNLWITMNIGGTTTGASPTYDGEMSPRLALTSVPYAFRAGQLAQYNSGNGFTSTLSLIQPTSGSQTFQIPDQGVAGTYNLCIANSSACGFALSSGNTNYIQNQPTLSSAQSGTNFWIDGVGRAATSLQAPLIDAATASTTLNIGATSGGNANAISLNQNVTVASGKSLTVNGNALFSAVIASQTAFQITNTQSTPLINVDSTTLNLVSNSSFEPNILNWTNKGTATLSQTSSQAFSGFSSLQAVVTAASSGVQTSTFSTAPSAGTQYEVTFMARCSAAISTFTYGRQDVNGTDINATTTAACNTNWQRYTFHYTTGATITNPNIYMTLGSTASGSLWVDAVQLIQTTVSGAVPYSAGSIKIDGVIGDPVTIKNVFNSTNAFEVQDTTGHSNTLVVDTANNLVNVNALNVAGTQVITSARLLQNVTASTAILTSGTLGVARGGTGAATLTAGGVLLGNGTSAVTTTGVLANGQLLIGDGSGAPAIGTLSGSGGITVTNGAGTITLGTDSTICTTSGNCAGSGGGITGSGTNGTIAMFTGSGTIANSLLTQSGSTVALSGTLQATTVDTNSLLTNGTTRIDATGNLTNIGDITMSGTIIRRSFNDVIAGTAGWFKLGTITLPQNGYNATIKLYGGSGYNADYTQNAQVELNIRTSNNASTNASGFAASATATRYGQNANFASPIKLVGNAAGIAATAYDIYVYSGTYVGQGYYTVDAGAAGSWSESMTAAADPGADSATVMNVPFEFVTQNMLYANSSGVGVGTSTLGSYRLNVQGGDANFSGNLNVGATTVITSGRVLQNVTADAGILTSGTIATSLLSGSYTGITGVGTVTAGTWNASTIAAGFGGTGISTYTIGDLLYASGSTALSKLADVAAGSCLRSGGVGVAPGWGSCGAAGTYVTLQATTPGTPDTGSFNISGTGIAATLQATTLQGNTLDVASGTTLGIAGTTATTINIATNALAHTIAVGNGAAVQGITIGSTNTTSSLLLQAGTGNLQIQTQGGTLGVGNNAVAQTITIGNTTAATAVTMQGGTGASAVSIQAGASGTIGVGTNATAKTINIGSVGSTAAATTLHIADTSNTANIQSVTIGSIAAAAHTTTIQGGNGATAINVQAAAGGNINIGTNAVTGKVINVGSVGTTASTTTVHIADTTGAAAQTVSIGSTSSSSTTTISAGTGDINLVTNASGAGVTVKTNTNTAGALTIQNAAGNSVLATDTTTGNTTLSQGSLYVNGLANPTGVTLGSSATGGTVAAGTYYYMVSATGTNGETQAVASSPTSVTTSGSTSVNTISWTAVTFATGYKVYRSTNGGSTWFVNSVSSGVTSITDNGSNFTWATSGTPSLYKNMTANVYLQEGASVLWGANGYGAVKYDAANKYFVLGDLNAGESTLLQGDSFFFENGAASTTYLTLNASGLTVNGVITSTVATGTAPLSVSSTTMVPNLNVQYLNGYTESQLAENIRANVNLSGGGTVTFDGSNNLSWSSRFIVIANGNGSDFSTSGYFDINQPASGTVITGVGGAGNVTANAAGIPMTGWTALYYILPIGSNNTTVNANFRIVTYTAGVQVPSSWVLLAIENGDSNTLKLGIGNTLRAGQSTTAGTINNPTFNSYVAIGNPPNPSSFGLDVQGAIRVWGPSTNGSQGRLFFGDNATGDGTDPNNPWVGEGPNDSDLLELSGSAGIWFQTSYSTDPNHYQSMYNESGDFCIDTTSCSHHLGVNGSAMSSTGWATGTPDIAEYITTAPDVTAYDVVAADPSNYESVVKATGSLRNAMVGAISDGTSGFQMQNAHYGQAFDGNVDPTDPNAKPMTLAGRIPVHVTNENGAIQPGDYLTVSNTKPGYAMKATQAGPTIGKALGFYDGSSGDTVLTLINLSYYNPNDGDHIQSQSGSFDTLQAGSATFSSLNVSGQTTLASLTVTGDVTVQGSLTVAGATSVATITVNGHIITSGQAPVIAVGDAAGKPKVVNGVTDTSTMPSATVDGNDSAGTISVTTGDNSVVSGALVHLSFAQAFGSTFKVVISPSNGPASRAQAYIVKTSTGFDLVTDATLSSSTNYQFDYMVLGSEVGAAP